MNMLEVIDHPQSADGASPDAPIRELKLARPPVNALNADLLRAIVTALEAAASRCAAVIFTGQPGVFSAGLDVRAMLALDRTGVTDVFVHLWRAARALAHSPVPLIFGLTGHSPAGGTVLAIHGDYRIMAQGEFRIGLNEVQVGLFPGPLIHGGFRRLVGGRAAQLLTRGVLMDPSEALRVGLVDELCNPADVSSRALAVAREFCALPPEPMLRTRALVRRDLQDLFGNPAQAMIFEREFGATAADYLLAPATLERLKQTFMKPR
jgi:Delta3-Delta2-enoyl-CoA isomerase